MFGCLLALFTRIDRWLSPARSVVIAVNHYNVTSSSIVIVALPDEAASQPLPSAAQNPRQVRADAGAPLAALMEERA
ncbi:MAG TPA: hypothetical protein VMF58_16095 [Rhizomicrobium sp.]|nr:hypothetical protein [Rhizomicrobium sp.]